MPLVAEHLYFSSHAGCYNQKYSNPPDVRFCFPWSQLPEVNRGLKILSRKLRNKQYTSVKLHSVLSSVTTFLTALPHLAWDMHRPCVPSHHEEHPTLSSVP